MPSHSQRQRRRVQFACLLSRRKIRLLVSPRHYRLIRSRLRNRRRRSLSASSAASRWSGRDRLAVRSASWLFKSHADAFLFTPDDTAGQVIAIRHQSEPSGDSDWTRDLERSAGSGHISNRAIDAAPAEFDGPALQDTMPGRNPLFVAHRLWRPSRSTGITGFREVTPSDAKISRAAKKILGISSGSKREGDNREADQSMFAIIWQQASFLQLEPIRRPGRCYSCSVRGAPIRAG